MILLLNTNYYIIFIVYHPQINKHKSKMSIKQPICINEQLLIQLHVLFKFILLI